MSKVSWPAWFYGPNNQSAVFESEGLVPKGWHDHPSKVSDEKPNPTPTPAATKPNSANPGDNSGDSKGDGTVALDTYGWPFDPELHAATQSKTKAGLWRMKVGVSRPAPKPGFPVAALDL